ncbi:MFS transporter [Rhodovastum atsumiense]|uniref:MFS transporter n=1 Tax=Rhodovastum atsumiense TaxID=504468 RepID=A0A5M6IPQ5_9PROT|nr:MFS transporter [Rhodovastum atsumiense]KAA5610216.1 MFS transporter [Rhodovastum atsumiense]
MTRNQTQMARERLAGLDWLNFCVATLQTGFGPFIAVYLTGNKWTQGSIGLALGVGTVAMMASQVPAGALVDVWRHKRGAVMLSTVLVAISAAMLALWPATLPVMTAQALHGFASCMLTPAIAALTMALVGPALFAARIGRNARFAAIGNACGALLMGAVGTWVNSQAVFWLAAFIAVPALLALSTVHGGGHGASLNAPPPAPGSLQRLLKDRRLIAIAGCILLFHLCNAALLPLAGGTLTRQAGDSANLLIAACIIGPQFLVALLSPSVAVAAERWGRRPVMLLGFAALPLRAAIFAGTQDPAVMVAAQILDGISAAMLGVMLPLVAADLTRGSGRFNLCLGLLGLATGIGATLSTVLAGGIADLTDDRTAFLLLALVGVVAVFAVELVMPETRARNNWRPAAEVSAD